MTSGSWRVAGIAIVVIVVAAASLAGAFAISQSSARRTRPGLGTPHLVDVTGPPGSINTSDGPYPMRSVPGSRSSTAMATGDQTCTYRRRRTGRALSKRHRHRESPVLALRWRRAGSPVRSAAPSALSSANSRTAVRLRSSRAARRWTGARHFICRAPCITVTAPNFREIAGFTPFDGTPPGARVATTSTTTGANLLVSGVAAGGSEASVLKYEFVRPNAESTTLQAVRVGKVWSGKTSQPPLLGSN